jgi:ActR/RegA family two-component response regulator
VTRTEATEQRLAVVEVTVSKNETITAPERLGAASRKVLVVDDDTALRKNLVRAFERNGFDVAAEFWPDFAVLDLNLQDGYGMELVAAL